VTRVRALCAAALALALLGACGKRAELREPDDATEPYTYPKAYPNPASVDPNARPVTRAAPKGAGDISVEPSTSRKTTTYGTPAE
jgi:hypothetical protein